MTSEISHDIITGKSSNTIPLEKVIENRKRLLYISDDYKAKSKESNCRSKKKHCKDTSLSIELRSKCLPVEKSKELLKLIFSDVDEDDRDLYRIPAHKAKEASQSFNCELYERVQMSELRKMLTYGEVSPNSVHDVLIPFLNINSDDVFYDLGCGTGKIVFQIAFQTCCTKAKGIELLYDRVKEGISALDRLRQHQPPSVVQRITIVHGDIMNPPEDANMLDATVVFVNNVCFGPALMMRVMNSVRDMPYLRRLVTLRKICERHSDRKCRRKGSACIYFVHPPKQATVSVTWTQQTSAFLYIRKQYADDGTEIEVSQ